jgi:hypothetical protein
MAAAGMEKIYFLSGDDEGKDHPVISRRAPGKYNLIRDKVVYGRGLGAGKFGVHESVSVPDASGGHTWVKVEFAVNLTWRRSNEFSSNVDTFHIVPAQLLNSDAVLGSDGAMEDQLPSGQFLTIRRSCAQPG